MKRETKYRFFREKPSPKMIYPQDDYYVRFDGTPYGLVKYPEKTELVKLRVIPLQYIGKIGKNKVEAYEGDIIQIEGDKYKIIFNEDYLCHMFWKIDFLRLPEDNKDIPITWHFKYEIELLGNEFENPELLNSQKVEH